MSFVNQGIKFINSIYDNYFDSNAKITLNDNEMKQDSEYDKQKQGYENKKTEKAVALKVPVISVSEFKSKFNIH